jgi:hypothetical protein
MKRCLFLLLPLSLLLGCAGYQLGPNYKPSYKKIFIENFKSQVDEPALENLVTTTVIKEIQKDGTLEVTDAAHADVILRGVIDSFEMTPVRFSRVNEITPTEASVTLSVKYSLIRRGETKPLVESRASGTTRFFIGSDIQSDKRQGVPLASEDLGREIVAAIAEGW